MFYKQYVGFPGGSVVKNMPAIVGETGQILDPGRRPGEENDNSLQDLVWEIPQTEEDGGLQSMGSQSQTGLSD